MPRLTYRDLHRRYKAKHGNFVEPKQGFQSLHESLWLAYSMGRRRGFTDLGTYANKPGDHGYWRACAVVVADEPWPDEGE